MMTPLAAEQLEALRRWPTPAISNAIETFNVRSRNTGFMGPEIVCRYPEFPPIVGYAATCKIRASVPADQDYQSAARDEWWRHIESIPAPRIIVIQDLDQPPVGSFWGEVNANLHKAMGAVGVGTDGGVRDLDEVRELGFPFLGRPVACGPARLHPHPARDRGRGAGSGSAGGRSGADDHQLRQVGGVPVARLVEAVGGCQRERGCGSRGLTLCPASGP